MSLALIIVLSFVGSIITLFLLSRIGKGKRDERKRLSHLDEISKWKKGDQLKVVLTSSIYYTMNKDVEIAKNNGKANGSMRKNHVELVSWGENEFIFKTESGSEYYGKYDDIEMNTSSDFRERNKKMKEFMGSLNDTAKFREDRFKKLLGNDQ